MKIDSKRVLVTGAGGFIGSHLAEALVIKGCKVKALLHYDSRAHRGNLEFVPREILADMEIVQGDVSDAYFMQKIASRCDIVFHLAALIGIPYSYHAAASYVWTNAMGTLNVMEACRLNEIEKVIHTSTSECYGTALYTPIDEHHPLQAQSPYSASKIAADKIAESYFLSFGTRVVTLRPFNTFGPRQSARAVIPTILGSLLSGQNSLRLGFLEPVRDMNYVADTIDGFLRAGECDNSIGETINVGTGKGQTIQEIASAAMDLVGKKVPIEADSQRIRPERSEVLKLICDNSKAKALLGWRPTISFHEGLEQTADFISKHLDMYRPEIFQL